MNKERIKIIEIHGILYGYSDIEPKKEGDLIWVKIFDGEDKGGSCLTTGTIFKFKDYDKPENKKVVFTTSLAHPELPILVTGIDAESELYSMFSTNERFTLEQKNSFILGFEAADRRHKRKILSVDVETKMVVDEVNGVCVTKKELVVIDNRVKALNVIYETEIKPFTACPKCDGKI